jgi:hypothetical protein
MKMPALFGGALTLATLVGGCVVAPVEPVPVYAAPPPPAVVIRPAPRYHYRRHHGAFRHWR